MDHGIYSAASGSLAALRRLDVVTQNLANAGTSGFKADVFVQRADAIGSSFDDLLVQTPISRGDIAMDFSQGPIDTTGNPFHVAINGEGFFVTDGPQGQQLTRRGSFSVDADGFLVNTDGSRVQGTGGDISIGDLASRPGQLQVGEDGTVTIGREEIGRIRVVEVSDPQNLARASGAAFVAAGLELQDREQGSFKVSQGALEGANVSVVENLVALIDASRAFEAYMRAAERFGETTQKAIGEVGRV